MVEVKGEEEKVAWWEREAGEADVFQCVEFHSCFSLPTLFLYAFSPLHSLSLSLSHTSRIRSLAFDIRTQSHKHTHIYTLARLSSARYSFNSITPF